MQGTRGSRKIVPPSYTALPSFRRRVKLSLSLRSGRSPLSAPQVCVNAAYSIASAAGVVGRAQNITLQQAVMSIWDDEAKEQIEIIKYATSLATHLHRVLNEHIARFNPDKLVLALCKVRDGELRDKFRALRASIEDEDARRQIRETVNDAWVELAQTKRKKRSECRQSHVRIEHMEGNGSAEERLARHVIRVHGI